MIEQIILICGEGLARVDVTLCNFLCKLLSPITYLLKGVFWIFQLSHLYKYFQPIEHKG